MSHIILIHLGDSEPRGLTDCIEQIQLVCKIPIHVIASPVILNTLTYDINKVDVSTILPSQYDNELHLYSILPRGFWQFATERFFVLHNYMKQYELTDVIHMEYDNLLYYDASRFLDKFRTKDMWLVLESPNRCIPGFMYIKSSHILFDMLPDIVKGAAMNKNDMETLAIYANKNNNVGCLPVLGRDIPLRYSDTSFGVLFDGAAVGQYIGGVDPKVNPVNTIGYINENTFNCGEQKVEWKNILGMGMVPYMNDLPLINLHIHSKDLQRWRSMTKFISGELIQETCDVYLGLSENFQFNPRINSQVTKHKYLDALVEPWNNPPRLFCYGDCLDIFKTKQQYMLNPYILVTHNSDKNITEEYVSIAEDPLLTHWYAQNMLVAHEKISMMPIGIANSMWPHGDLSILNSVVNSIKQKTKDVYFYFNVHTNVSERQSCLTKLRFNGFTFGEEVSYTKYLEDLALHDYAICPPGNGVDSHRIWECLYLNVCPVMLESEFSRAVAKHFQVVLVKDWSDLLPESLPKRTTLLPIPTLKQFFTEKFE